jgi:hypothetical protein
VSRLYQLVACFPTFDLVTLVPEHKPKPSKLDSRALTCAREPWIVHYAMESLPESFDVPLNVDVNTGRIWSACKRV